MNEVFTFTLSLRLRFCLLTLPLPPVEVVVDHYCDYGPPQLQTTVLSTGSTTRTTRQVLV